MKVVQVIHSHGALDNMSEEQAVVEETPTDTLLDNAAPTLSEGEYFLAEGINGSGDTPEW